MRKSIKIRLMVLISLISVLCLVVSGIQTRNSAKKTFEEYLDKTYVANSNYYAETVNGWLKEQSAILDSGIEYLKNVSENNIAFARSYFEAVVAENTNTANVFFGLENGTYIDGKGSIKGANWNLLEQEWYLEAIESDNIIFSDSIQDTETNEIVITVSKKFATEKGTQGVIGMDLSLTSLVELLDEVVDRADGDYVFVANQQGTILIHPNEAFIVNGTSSANINDAMGGAYAISVASDEEFTDYNGISSYITAGDVSTAGWTVYIVTPVASYNVATNNFTSSFMVSLVAAVIVSLILSVIISIGVSKPIVSANKQLKEIVDDINAGHGDLTKRIQTKSKDEIGNLVAGINGFIEIQERIIGQIENSGSAILDSSKKMVNNIETANDNASNISSVTEELAASMSLVADTSEELKTKANSLLTIVGDVVEQIYDGNCYAEKMADRATDVKELCSSKQETIAVDLEEKRTVLEKAIEESKKVDDINKLTDEILKIASKTNLLALNASIEAARAGEVGKGFAVVADEIRTLADNSRETANNIQEISNAVVVAVENLMVTSAEVIEYMSDTVNEDYARFNESGQNYYDDAGHIQEILDELRHNMDTISNTTHVMVENMTQISDSMTECSSGVNDVAENTVCLVSVVSDIKSESDENTENIDVLRKETEIFRK